jgi:hypothetical protein
VKSKRKNAFLVSLEHGVCVKWKQHKNNNNNNGGINDDDGLCSMVNGWSSKDSPIPSIKIDLLFSPLGMGLLDFTMATVELSSAILLRNPGAWRERWCQLEIPSSMQSGSGIDNNTNSYFHRFPLVKIQAVFTRSIPSSGESNSFFSFASTQQHHLPPPFEKLVILLPTRGEIQVENGPAQTQVEFTSQSPPPRVNSDATQSLSALDGIRPKKMTREHQDKDLVGTEEEDDENGGEDDEDMHSLDIASEAAVGIDDGSTASRNPQTDSALDPHLLCAETYWIPGSCSVCSRVLIGRNGGFHSKECGIDCCGDCRLNVDLRVPCGSDLAHDIVEKNFKGKMSLSGLLNYVAPDETFEQKKIEEDSMHSLRKSESLSTAGGLLRALMHSNLVVEDDLDGIAMF